MVMYIGVKQTQWKLTREEVIYGRGSDTQEEMARK